MSPKGTTIAWESARLAFADIHSPGTVANLLSNPSIEINVVDIFSRRGYRFKGVAEVLSDGALFDKIVAHYRAAGSLHSIKHIVIVKVDQTLPIRSTRYDTGMPEDEIRTRWMKYWNEMNSRNGSL